MSENTETVETVETAVETTGNAVVDGLIALAADKSKSANTLAEKVGNAKGNFAKSIKEARENSEDPEIVEYREWEEKVYEEINRRREIIDAKLAEALGTESVSAAELDKAEADYKVLARAAKDAWKAAQSTAKMFGVKIPEHAPELKTLGGRSSSVAGPAGSSGRRFRFDDVTVNGESVGSLSKAALVISGKAGTKVTAKDLQDALIDTAKTDDVSKMNGVSFDHTVTLDGKNHVFGIVVYKSVEADDSNTETEDTAAE